MRDSKTGERTFKADFLKNGGWKLERGLCRKVSSNDDREEDSEDGRESCMHCELSAGETNLGLTGDGAVMGV